MSEASLGVSSAIGRWPSRALIAGCGDIGLRIARQLRAAGVEVTGIVRSAQKQDALRALGAVACGDDLDRPRDAGDWPWLFWSAPPRNEGRGDPRLRDWLAAQRGRIGRVVYLSTTGVYGDCAGRWIDESEPVKPRTPRAERRADAEQAVLDWCATHGAEAVLLRIPGIYGPGRLPVERLRSGAPVMREAEAPFSNRIHADDLADVAVLAAQRGVAGAAYNVADGQPTTMTDYYLRCAEVLGLPLPPQIGREQARTEFTAALWSYMEESKRLLTDRAREELGFAPRYPGLREGLAASVQAR